MKKYALTQEEKEIETAIEKDLLVNELSPKKKKETEEMAKEVIQKTKNINVRLTSKDLIQLKSKALEKGLPYQTIVSTLVHQYNQGKVKIEI